MITRSSRIRNEACKFVTWGHHRTGETDPCRMTIGFIEEFVRDGEVVDGFKSC
jgi:hypothetical protein